jgi:ATP-binding cassette, subfamily B, bacterial
VRLAQLVRAHEGGAARGLTAPPLDVPALARRFWPYMRPYRRTLAAALALVVIVPAIDTATIYTYKLLVDDVIVPQDLHALIWVGGLFAVLTILGGFASFGDDYVGTWVAEHVLLDLRIGVFAHLQRLSLDFFDRRRLGDLIARLTGDVSAIETMTLYALGDALSYLAQILFFGAALLLLSWQLALTALLIAPLFWLATRHFSREIKHASREKRRRSGLISAVAEESLGNVAVVQAYNRQEGEVERLRRESQGALDAEMTATRLRAVFSPLLDVFEMVGALLVVGLGTYELSQGRLSYGGMVAFLAYLTQLYGPIRRLSRLVNSVFAATASAERVSELLDERPSVPAPSRPWRGGRPRGHLAFDDVSFTYPGTGREALHDISFDVAPGEIVALAGASGAGKSTVAKLILRFYDPTAGAVRLDGDDLREHDLRHLRDHIALLLQETLIFDATVRENIAFGRPQASAAAIERAARAADAHDFITSLPEGYDTLVGQRGRLLSGGQRQRIAIARAMVRDAPLLVLDEPTTGLDVASGERILGPLRRLMAGRATVVISHDLLIARDADRIVVLDGGRVAEAGGHAALLARDGVYARLWRLREEGMQDALVA